jgi:hypothetical protein
LRFWWPGSDPESALDALQVAIQALPDGREVRTPADPTWRAPQPGTTLATIRDYLDDHGLTVVRAELGPNRRRLRRWEGLYTLTLSPERNTHA